MSEFDKTYYQIYRSRDKGNFWSNITHGMELDWEKAQHLMENEKTKHPSDWLRLVKVQVTTEDEYLGNSPKKKEPLIHGMTIPEYIKVMERAHEATKNSKLVFK